MFFILVPTGEDAAMQYTVQMLPAKIANALPDIVRRLPGGETALVSKDLVFAKDRAGKYRFGIAERPTHPTEPLQRTYLITADDDGTLHAIHADTSAMPGEQVVDGGITRAILVALAAYRDSTSKSPLATIGWRSTDQVVTVMFVPARADNEPPMIGGATSLGVETHYEISRSELKVIRTTFAR
jgi:hypothetical protein